MTVHDLEVLGTACVPQARTLIASGGDHLDVLTEHGTHLRTERAEDMGEQVQRGARCITHGSCADERRCGHVDERKPARVLAV